MSDVRPWRYPIFTGAREFFLIRMRGRDMAEKLPVIIDNEGDNAALYVLNRSWVPGKGTAA